VAIIHWPSSTCPARSDVQEIYNRSCDLRSRTFSKETAARALPNRHLYPANVQIDPSFIGDALALARPAWLLSEFFLRDLKKV
jgi:hypothetical protein